MIKKPYIRIVPEMPLTVSGENSREHHSTNNDENSCNETAPKPTPTRDPVDLIISEKLLALQNQVLLGIKDSSVNLATTATTLTGSNLDLTTRTAIPVSNTTMMSANVTQEKQKYLADDTWIKNLPQSFIDEYLEASAYNADGSVSEYVCRSPYSHFNLNIYGINYRTKEPKYYSDSLDCTTEVVLCFEDGTSKKVTYYSQYNLDNYFFGDWWRLTDKYINEYLNYDEQSGLYTLKPGKSFSDFKAEKANFVDERIVYDAKDLSSWLLENNIYDEYLTPKSYGYFDGAVKDYFLNPEYSDLKSTKDLEQIFEDETAIHIDYRIEATDKNGKVHTTDYYHIGSLSQYLVPVGAIMTDDENVDWWKKHIDEFFEYDKNVSESSRLYTLKEGRSLQELKALSPF